MRKYQLKQQTMRICTLLHHTPAALLCGYAHFLTLLMHFIGFLYNFIILNPLIAQTPHKLTFKPLIIKLKCNQPIINVTLLGFKGLL